MKNRLTRRQWLSRQLKSVAALFTLMAFRGIARGQDRDYFTGTDFVGKNRTGEFRNFYINYWKPHRRIEAQEWTLEVAGLCRQPRRFSLAELQALPAREQVSRLKCVECWSAKARWVGFRFAQLEALVRPLEQARGVLFHCADEYVEYLPLETLRHPRTLMVTHMNGSPLSDEHGFPLRVIAPMKYGYKNPKAILRLEFVAAEVWGTWSKIGPYSADGTILPGTDHPLEYNKQPRRIPGGEITHY